MTKKQRAKRTIDTIVMELVPKIVDDVPKRKTLREIQTYWRYAEGQAVDFLGKLPTEYNAGLSIQKFRKEKAALYACKDSSVELMIGFKPMYPLLATPLRKKRTGVYTQKDMVACPTYDLAFKLISREAALTIIPAALEQFHALMGDDTGPLMVYRTRRKKVVRKDVQLLADYLPRGTLVHARCNYGASNGKAEYRI